MEDRYNTDIINAVTNITSQISESLNCRDYNLILKKNFGSRQPGRKFGNVGWFYNVSDQPLSETTSNRLQRALEASHPVKGMCQNTDPIADGTFSWLALPLEVENEVVGALYLDGIRRSDIDTCFRLAPMIASQIRMTLESLQRADKLRESARRDCLTGLYNRGYIDDVLEREFERAQRYGDDLSVIMLDLDHFKAINDEYGHPVGDTVLKTVAKRLESNVRNVDLVGRYGGEEFLVVLPETSADRAKAIVAQRLQDAMASEPVEVNGESIQVTASFGVAGFRETDQVSKDLVCRADGALYEAKRSGRDCVETSDQQRPDISPAKRAS